MTPTAPGDATHFVSYQAKPTRDVTDQTPLGKFRKDLQHASLSIPIPIAIPTPNSH